MSTDTLEVAREVFKTEAQAIENLSKLLTADFRKSVELVLKSKGRFVISGMGKSGHIGVKISATLASTGTPSFFMHPAEAIHGDLGMLTKDDVLLAISNSGESEEIVRIIPLVQRMGIPLIGMAGRADSTLAREADYFLNISVEQEACPLQLAPTSSTTATLAMGDALAVALMRARNFQPEDFAMFHPGGSLGKKLLTRVRDVMISKNLPIVQSETTFSNLIEIMTSGKLGLCVVVDNDRISGIITDGDLRRALHTNDPFKLFAKNIMTLSPKIISPNVMVTEAEVFMKQNKIKDLLVVENHELKGVLTLYDAVLAL